MRLNFFLACLVISLAVPQSPQSASSAPIGQPSEKAVPIMYAARVPKPIARSCPKGAVTRFFGLTTMQRTKLALHFYDVSFSKTARDSKKTIPCRLDIFVITPKGKTNFYKRLHTLALERDRPQTKEAPPLSCPMLAWWLDPDKKTIPLLMLDINQQNSLSFGRTYLIIFPNGLLKPPVLTQYSQTSSEFGWSSYYNLDRRDKNGYICLENVHNDRGTFTYSVSRWNGKGFELADSITTHGDDPIRYEWNGEKFIKYGNDPDRALIDNTTEELP